MSTPSMKAILRSVLVPVQAEAADPEATASDAPPRHGPGSNGAPPLNETALEEITRIGRAMYGERWISSIAKDAGEHARQVQRWRAGTSQPSARALNAVRQAARRHIARIERALGD